MSRYDEYVRGNDTPKTLCSEIDALKAELEAGKKRWAYYEARFVEVCKNCSEEEKQKCLMYPEHCEGQCKEMVDLVSLIDKALERDNIK